MHPRGCVEEYLKVKSKVPPALKNAELPRGRSRAKRESVKRHERNFKEAEARFMIEVGGTHTKCLFHFFHTGERSKKKHVIVMRYSISMFFVFFTAAVIFDTKKKVEE